MTEGAPSSSKVSAMMYPYESEQVSCTWITGLNGRKLHNNKDVSTNKTCLVGSKHLCLVLSNIPID